MAKTDTPSVDRTPQEEAERKRRRDSERDPVGPNAYQEPETPRPVHDDDDDDMDDDDDDMDDDDRR